jgi:uncharacterized SAM-binding protein YcdF (DUF218 family)
MSDLLRTLREPFTLLLLLVGLGLLRLWWQRDLPRRRLLWVTVPYLLLTLISLPAVGLLALNTLERRHPPALHRPASVEAIVVLGSAVAHTDPILGQSQLDRPALDRTWHGYRLYREGPPCLVLVSGGKPNPDEPGPPCADVMAEELRRLGARAKDVAIENESRNTYENAVESARLLRERNVSHILLVTDASHLPRAAACFRKQGLEVLSSGCGNRSAAWKVAVTDFVPSLTGLRAFHAAAHEWGGLVVYWVRGRI